MFPSNAETHRALLDWTRAHQRHMVSATRALCSIESPTGDADAQLRVFALLGTLLEDADYRTTITPAADSGGVLTATPAAHDPDRGIQLLVGHSDTVWPHGTLRTMPLVKREDRLYGPGTYDCKAGLVQAVFALRALHELGVTPTIPPVLLINADEEVGSGDTTPLVKEVAATALRAFVLEPSLGPEGKLKTARKGVGHFTIRVTGKAAHAGLDPRRGISATVELAHVIHALHALNDHERGITVNIGEIRGGTRRNVIPAQATAEVDVRCWTHGDAAEIETRIRDIRHTLPGAALDISGGFVKQPLEPSDGGTDLWSSAARIATDLGISLDQGAAGGASDGNTTALFCPTLDGLGAVGDGAHAAHEHVRIASLPERAALLAGLLLA